jgi:hypothetical protein
MPYPKDNAKMTGDTHLPDVDSDIFEKGSADAVGMDETPSDRGQATERGDQKRPAARSTGKAGKAGEPKGRKAKASTDSSGRG